MSSFAARCVHTAKRPPFLRKRDVIKDSQPWSLRVLCGSCARLGSASRISLGPGGTQWAAVVPGNAESCVSPALLVPARMSMVVPVLSPTSFVNHRLEVRFLSPAPSSFPSPYRAAIGNRRRVIGAADHGPRSIHFYGRRDEHVASERAPESRLKVRRQA